jgi:hypothetical protein
MLLLTALALAHPRGVQGRPAECRPEPLEWPPVHSTCRPSARWWWPGSAVDEAELRRQLKLIQEAGFGGVEVSPIYGVQGAEERYVTYLSRRWLELFGFTVGEAMRLGLGVDLIQGTGWPFGGPWVAPEDAAARVVFTTMRVKPGERPSQALPGGARLAALMAYSGDGQVRDLTDRVDAGGKIDWEAPAGSWLLCAAQIRPTGQQVKRAAPGGEGPVVDPFSAAALDRYCSAFDQVPAAASRRGGFPRCLFNDSFEVYGANWTPDLFLWFQRRRGYDLRRQLPALMGEGEPVLVSRVRSDYRETIADLLREQFALPWSAWAHRHGFRTRYQAHGSPGNLLDLYAAADIPETEMFGPARRSSSTHPSQRDAPPAAAPWQSIVTCKLASSGAHLGGRPLCSSESFTWLGEHFRVPLAEMKGQADSLFVAGVNHLFYHGTPFSPATARWPGWLFYASTDVTPTNSWWRDLPALNAYVARCQSFLQTGLPENEVLLYFPIHDLWAEDTGSRDLLQYITVHNTSDWLEGNLGSFARAARLLWQRGYSFDMVSDRQLQQHGAGSGVRLSSGGSSVYRVLVVAGCTRMPPETLSCILDLAEAGATVLFLGDVPREVPGLGRAQRRASWQAIFDRVPRTRRVGEGLREAPLGSGRLLIGSDLEALLRRAAVARESMVDHGVEFVRRRLLTPGIGPLLPGTGGGPRSVRQFETQPVRPFLSGRIYFLANRSDRALDGWVRLATEARAAVLFDPMHGRRGIATVRKARTPWTEIYLQLAPGESVIVRTSPDRLPGGPAWPYRRPAGEPVPLEGDWHVEFIAGGPSLPPHTLARQLTSWTTWPDPAEALRAFSGSSRYRITFARPAVAADAWALDLGEVCHSARVSLNGQDAGSLTGPPFRLDLADGLRRDRNELVVEVTNLMANRIADMDRRKLPWRNFYFVDGDYGAFDALKWEPMPSGLLGPVRLLPLRRLIPAPTP